MFVPGELGWHWSGVCAKSLWQKLRNPRCGCHKMLIVNKESRSYFLKFENSILRLIRSPTRFFNNNNNGWNLPLSSIAETLDYPVRYILRRKKHENKSISLCPTNKSLIIYPDNESQPVSSQHPTEATDSDAMESKFGNLTFLVSNGVVLPTYIPRLVHRNRMTCTHL